MFMLCQVEPICPQSLLCYLHRKRHHSGGLQPSSFTPDDQSVNQASNVTFAMKMEDRISEQRHSARTITTPKHLRSSVWKYFGFYAANGKITTKNKAVCRLCTKQLTYSSTTTNLRSHLQACHRSETAEAPQATGATLQPYVTASYSVHSASADPSPETCGSSPTESPSAPVECKLENTDATISGPGAAGLHAVKLEMRVPPTSQASDVIQSSDMEGAPPSRPPTSCDLDAMDLDQLRREKMKMQIKVLRLQEEYYSQKIKKLKT